MHVTEIRYSPLDVEALPELTPLQAALIQHGYQILDTNDVLKYQEEFARDFNHKLLGRLKLQGQISFVTFCAGLGAAIVFMIAQFHFGAAIAGIIGGAGVIIATNRAAWLNVYENPHNLWQWVSLQIHYKQSCINTTMAGTIRIPEKVQEINNTISHEVGLYGRVHWFQQDPFLFFEELGVRYYVAVWDEKGFILP